MSIFGPGKPESREELIPMMHKITFTERHTGVLLAFTAC